jgi:aerobic-type carbon monoxide dehydrogenase small subunit (CoxS/CutS family)
MAQWFKAQDVLQAKYCQDDVIHQAKEVLQRDEQSEEAFLGAQGVLLLCGLL